MPRAIVVFFVVAAFLILAVPALPNDLVKSTTPKLNPFTGAEPAGEVPYYPSTPGLTAGSPGDTVGFTQYDYQSNASTGRRIVVDGTGNVHVAWMNGNPYPSVRQIYYNCKTPQGWVWPAIGTPVSFRSGDGYTQMAVTPDDRAVICYHNATRAGLESTYVATDFANCLGTFAYAHPSNRFGGTYYIWPHIAVSQNGSYHMTSTRNAAPDNIIYVRSNNGGTTWTAPVLAGTANTLSQIVAASPVSNKVVVAYTKNVPNALIDSTSDLVFVESLDGITWDFANPTNVTGFGGIRDSLGVGWDIDAIYDYNDNLHFMYNTRWQNAAGNIYYLTRLFHYNWATHTATELASTDSLWPSAGCDFGNFGWHFSKVSMSVGVPPNPTNQIFAAYSDYDTADCSACGYANGDIYVHSSSDNGVTWQPRVNVTNSQTPLCLGGDCDSDNWPSMAEKADQSLHIFYVNDKDAGAIPQTQCSVTDNPMLYLAYPNPFFNAVDEQPLPKGYELSQNYPNPFNAQTTVSFEIAKPAHVRIDIFDVLGRKVATLLDEQRDAGPQQVIWNAGNQTSGMYTYKLTADKYCETRKMLLVK